MSEQHAKFEAYVLRGRPAALRSPTGDRDPIEVLVDEADPQERSRAHVALGLRALDRDDEGMATWHFREALELDPTDEVPRDELHRLGETASPRLEPVRRRSSLVSRLLGALRPRQED